MQKSLVISMLYYKYIIHKYESVKKLFIINQYLEFEIL